ncbi:hypothetical protein Moror_5205 [Moniliophthora roreri MCA 2997]|uniref:Uncharacterized protein n=1 Tax=Moniliophthora roreri (strain MCA 2997) TaxID=1381753 RepID=V2WQU6_MONRO|nr:hypothetical protein Moror_5205 [Moniliophthora roreri MCA 2997]
MQDSTGREAAALPQQTPEASSPHLLIRAESRITGADACRRSPHRNNRAQTRSGFPSATSTTRSLQTDFTDP